MFGSRPNKGDTARRTAFGKRCIFTEKPIPGMDRIDSGRRRDLQDSLAIEIAIADPRAAHAIGFIRFEHMQGMAIGFRINGD